MDLSYWELETFFRNRQLVVIGSGIVGLNAAIAYKKSNPGANVLVLERGILPLGASTKNAGFACFGSVSELLADFSKMPENVVLETVEMRLNGLKRLRKVVGDKAMDFRNHGGFEVFDDVKKFEKCADEVSALNKKLKTVTGRKETFLVDTKKISEFGMKGFSKLIESPLEGQIDTGKMMKRLLEIAVSSGIMILNNITVTGILQNKKGVELEINEGFKMQCENVIVATNGFARSLLPELKVIPARAQVLVTKPIRNLKLKGTFHYDEGFYYFRNINERVLFGGGRNLDLKTEETDQFGLTEKIQSQLNKILSEKILPGKKYEIDHRWSGIMGLGAEKKPIIKKLSKNIVVAVRMGGMGVAIGSLVGERAATALL
jgi:gamma-glutamylputrescine oxidase